MLPTPADLQRLRCRFGLTERQLAAAMGVSQSYVHCVLVGEKAVTPHFVRRAKSALREVQDACERELSQTLGVQGDNRS